MEQKQNSSSFFFFISWKLRGRGESKIKKIIFKDIMTENFPNLMKAIKL